MADIALLLVEDYESRMTRSIVKAGKNQGEEVDLVSLLSQRLDEVSCIRIAQEKFDFSKRAHTKSELGLAAINGFFSA